MEEVDVSQLQEQNKLLTELMNDQRELFEHKIAELEREQEREVATLDHEVFQMRLKLSLAERVECDLLHKLSDAEDSVHDLQTSSFYWKSQFETIQAELNEAKTENESIRNEKQDTSAVEQQYKEKIKALEEKVAERDRLAAEREAIVEEWKDKKNNKIMQYKEALLKAQQELRESSAKTSAVASAPAESGPKIKKARSTKPKAEPELVVDEPTQPDSESPVEAEPVDIDENALEKSHNENDEVIEVASMSKEEPVIVNKPKSMPLARPTPKPAVLAPRNSNIVSSATGTGTGLKFPIPNVSNNKRKLFTSSKGTAAFSNNQSMMSLLGGGIKIPKLKGSGL